VSRTCTTAANGRCTVASNEHNGSDVGILSFTVMGLVHDTFYYEMADDTDPDGDSDGTTISVYCPVPISMSVVDLDGAVSSSGSEWWATVTITVKDADQLPVPGATVRGSWSYSNKAVSCLTDATGQCSLTSKDVDGYTVEEILFTVDDVTHPEVLVWFYDAAGNSDPDGDSDGTTINDDRPVPIPMYVADLDAQLNWNTVVWWTDVTITIHDADQLPVAGAKVFVDWNPGDKVNCTTDAAGQCTLASDRLAASAKKIELKVDDVTHPDVLVWAYDDDYNTDPDGDSNGEKIRVPRPEPKRMNVVDLDGENVTDGEEWRTTVTITVRDDHQHLVAEAKVFGTWSYGKGVNCETDVDGRCSLTSDWVDGYDAAVLSFVVHNVTHPEPIIWEYDPVGNLDPDGDSDGTTITMDRPVPTPMYVVDLDGVNSSNGSKWRTNVTITLYGANQLPVVGAEVFGTWSYGSSKDCTTDANGQCSLLSSEFEGDQMSAIGLTVDSITHPEPLVWAYDAAGNSDPDGDSDGTAITMDRPVPTPMFVADLDGVSTQVSGTEWRATVTIAVLDADQSPVDGADLFGTWSNGKSMDCTTDSNGQCSLTSGKLKLTEVEAITFSVDDVTHGEVLVWFYDAAGNSDPEGDSDGTSITVSKP
jgi:hypothetical protein